MEAELTKEQKRILVHSLQAIAADSNGADTAASTGGPLLVVNDGLLDAVDGLSYDEVVKLGRIAWLRSAIPNTEREVEFQRDRLAELKTLHDAEVLSKDVNEGLHISDVKVRLDQNELASALESGTVIQPIVSATFANKTSHTVREAVLSVSPLNASVPFTFGRGGLTPGETLDVQMRGPAAQAYEYHTLHGISTEPKSVDWMFSSAVLLDGTEVGRYWPGSEESSKAQYEKAATKVTELERALELARIEFAEDADG